MKFREQMILEDIKLIRRRMGEDEKKDERKDDRMEIDMGKEALVGKVRDPRILGVCLSSRRNMVTSPTSHTLHSPAALSTSTSNASAGDSHFTSHLL